MMTLRKYEVPIDLGSIRFSLELPTIHRILTVQVYHEKPYILALVDLKTPPVPVVFLKLVLGAEVSERQLRGAEYIGSIQGDWFNGHFFRVRKPKGGRADGRTRDRKAKRRTPSDTHERYKE